MDFKKKWLYGHAKTEMYIVITIFYVLLCPATVRAEGEVNTDSWLFVNGCSVAEGSVVSPMTVFTFAFGNNVVNASVRDGNRTKFSLETIDGFRVGISVDMADDQIEPDRRWYITVIPDEELAPGMYCLTAYAGICAKNGKITENDFKVNFTVEGSETPETDQNPELTSTPDLSPDSDIISDSNPDFISELSPEPDTDSRFVPTESPASSPLPENIVPIESPTLSPLPENIENDRTGQEQNSFLLPEAESGNGEGIGASDGNETDAGQDFNMSLENTDSGALENQPSQPPESDAGLLQRPAVSKVETNRKKARKKNGVMKEEIAKDERLSKKAIHIQDQSIDSLEHFTVMKIELGQVGRKLQLAHQPDEYGKGLEGSVGQGGIQGATGNARRKFLVVLMLVFVIGVMTRTAGFWKDIV